jgi:hypothetical protein
MSGLGDRALDYSDFNEEPPSGGWKTKLKWGLILAGGPLLLLIGVGGFAAYVGTPEEQFDRLVERDAAVKPMLLSMRKHFPDEYASFRRTMLPQVERGANEEQMALASAQFMSGFNERHRWEVGRAPDVELKAFMAAQLTAFEKLSAQSEQACGAFANGRTLPLGTVNKTNTEALSTMSVRYIEAAAAGRDNASGRSRPNEADRIKLGQKLLAGGLRPDVRRLMERNAPPFSFNDGQMCHASLSVLRALTKLPPDVALRLLSEIVQTA